MSCEQEAHPSNEKVTSAHEQRYADCGCRSDPKEAQRPYLACLQGPKPTGQWHKEGKPSADPGRYKCPERKTDLEKGRDQSVFAYRGHGDQ